MNRREFLMAGGLVALGGLAPALDGKQQRTLRTGPYLQNPTADGMTVMWMTSDSCYGVVEYGPTERLGHLADAEVDGLRQAGNLLHRVRLRDLRPGTRYFYRVRCQPIVTYKPYEIVYGPSFDSPIHSFVTPDPAAQRVRFLVYNDIHAHVPLWRRLGATVAQEPVDFVFLNGDIIDDAGDDSQIVDDFLDVCTELFATRVPFFYTRGNHEVRGAYARQLKQYFDLPQDRYYYGFSWGPARFVVLDSGEDKPDDFSGYAGLCDFDAYRTAQQAWLGREAASAPFASARFRIAMHHIPAHYAIDPASDDNMGNHGAIDARKKWWPIFNQSGVDLYFGGHTHQLTMKPADPRTGHRFPVLIGGGPNTGTGTVMLVDIDCEIIRVKVFGDDGRMIRNIETNGCT
jgi:hypothetical protein